MGSLASVHLWQDGHRPRFLSQRGSQVDRSADNGDCLERRIHQGRRALLAWKLQTETVKALFSAYLWNRPQVFQILLLPRSSCEMTNRNEVTMYQERNVPLHWREKFPTEAILVGSYLWETAQRKYWTAPPQRPKGRFIGDQGREKSKMVGKQADFIWHPAG